MDNYDKSFHLSLNRMLGSRGKAILVTANLPDNLEGSIVAVFGDDSVGASKGFTEELCSCILIDRKASGINFINTPDIIRKHAEAWASSRNYLSRISFEDVPLS